MNSAYLERLVNPFVLKNRRERLLGFMKSTRRYDDFLWEFLHDPGRFDPECVVDIPGGEQYPKRVLERLRDLGAGKTAYLVGDCDPFEDGTVGPLAELLDACVGSMADALVYCPDANVAYYEGHEGFRLILRPRRSL